MKMNTRKAISVACALAMTLLVLAPVTRGSERDQATQLTFSQPIQIPGNVVLQPGTYWFVVANSPSDRNVVQVFDANWQLITTTLTASAEIGRPSDNTLLFFAERSADKPNVLLEWYYPGRTIGHEFVYSASEGRAITEETVNYVTILAQPAPVAPSSGSTNAHY